MALQPFILGPGKVYAVPPSTATDPSPFQFLETSEISIETKQDTKDVYGGSIDPLITVSLRRTWSGKMKQPFIQGSAIARMQGGALVASGKHLYDDESTGAISGATYTVTHAAGFELLSVKDENGYSMKKVAASPGPAAEGEYSVTSGGVFTFHTSANGKTYSISYFATDANMFTLNWDTKTMGLTSQFKLAGGGDTVDGNPFAYEFGAVSFPGFTLPFKAEDTVMPDVDFKIFLPNGSTRIGSLYLPSKI